MKKIAGNAFCLLRTGIVVQVGGAKRWVIYDGPFKNPLRHQMVGRPHEKPAKKGVCMALYLCTQTRTPIIGFESH